MFLLGVVCERSSHAEVHVAVFAAVRFLACVESHVILQGGVGSKLRTALVTTKRLLIKVFSAFVVNHPWNETSWHHNSISNKHGEKTAEGPVYSPQGSVWGLT